MCSTSAYLCCITRCKICKCTRQHQIEYTHHKEIGARQKEANNSCVCTDARSIITLHNAQASVQILHTNQEGNTTWYACTHTAPPKKIKQITHSTTSSIHTVHTLHQHISHALTATHYHLSDSLPDTHSFSLQTHAPPLCFAAFLENDRPQPLPCAPTWEMQREALACFEGR